LHHFNYVADELYCENVPVATIAEAVGTPFYLYSHATLSHHFKTFDQAFGKVPHLVCFALKANSNLLIRETEEKAGSAKSDWVNILGRRCFLNANRQELAAEPSDILSGVSCPVLILEGTSGSGALAGSAVKLDSALAGAGNKNHTLKHYSQLDHFFGKPVNDGTHRLYYDTDNMLLADVKAWAEAVIREASKPAQKPSPPEPGNKPAIAASAIPEGTAEGKI